MLVSLCTCFLKSELFVFIILLCAAFANLDPCISEPPKSPTVCATVHRWDYLWSTDETTVTRMHCFFPTFIHLFFPTRMLAYCNTFGHIWTVHVGICSALENHFWRLLLVCILPECVVLLQCCFETCLLITLMVRKVELYLETVQKKLTSLLNQ